MRATVSNGTTLGKSTIRVLIADGDEQQRTALATALSARPEFDVVATVGHGERATLLVSQLRPDIALVDMAMMRSDGSSAAEHIAFTTPGCQVILLSSHNEPSVVRRAMQCGAREFLIKPIEEKELIGTILRVYEGAVRQQSAVLAEMSPPPDRARTDQVIAVWGPKGGVGRTFLAVNLAVAMASVEHHRVLLMDGCLGFCTADVALNISTGRNILDLVGDGGKSPDSELVSRVVVHHASGLDVLLAPPVEAMLQIAPAQLQRIMSLMRSIYEYIVIDTRPLLDSTTVALLDLSDVILTVCNPDIASLRNLRIFLDAAGYLGYGPDLIRLIVNRYDMRGAIPQEEIEGVCRRRVAFAIRNDTEAVSMSINRGEPLVTSQPQRPISVELIKLASILTRAQGSGPAKAESAAVGVLDRLFGRSKLNNKPH